MRRRPCPASGLVRGFPYSQVGHLLGYESHLGFYRSASTASLFAHPSCSRRFPRLWRRLRDRPLARGGGSLWGQGCSASINHSFPLIRRRLFHPHLTLSNATCMLSSATLIISF
ncbi:uncharacterized protein K452DRAFT_97508 [Aplosporella prunicola CBS 121167]|uniref:Uncharacterized protein n=1 Tax=Aplosporella prunicola CBS 121167 TaxID=1176127 RepID=A0A6A6B278_9PEZI|nr:uncharacterized protein K452DRAFT_97508 [Aplosporella prunicola CBS 121167]KAF2137688.1 hypothetical protein K452DRAFT_97508 [Aplosporella prunicola CBS 121167]